jgi:hypothetical protein
MEGVGEGGEVTQTLYVNMNKKKENTSYSWYQGLPPAKPFLPFLFFFFSLLFCKTHNAENCRTSSTSIWDVLRLP